MRRVTLLGAVVLGLLLVLVLAQLLLPGIAARRLRDRLGQSGQVLQVEVHAFPAIELLWHQADRVVIRMGGYRSGAGHLSSLLDQTSGVSSLDASAQTLTAGLLTLRDATLHKRGSSLSGSAQVNEADLRAAVPVLDGVVPVASSGGQLVLRGTATLLGVSATVDATVGATNGQLLVQPDVPFGGLATITVFSDPRLEIDSLSAAADAAGFTVSATGQLH